MDTYILVGSKEDTSKTRNNSAMNVNVPSRLPHVLSLPNNSIHTPKLSTVPSPDHTTSEHGAQEREKGQEPTTQSTPRVNSKKLLRFSKVCEVITFADSTDEVRHRLFHYFANRVKEVHPTRKDEHVVEDKMEVEQRQEEDNQAKSHHRR